jgi:hypothetical protein
MPTFNPHTFLKQADDGKTTLIRSSRFSSRKGMRQMPCLYPSR